MPDANDKPVRVVIADDDPDILVLLRSMLSLDQRIDVAGEAIDGGEALTRFLELRPDVLVLDERMPVMYGLEVAAQVLGSHPDQVVILCTAYIDDTVRTSASELGVRAVVGKNDIPHLADEILRLAG
jgi:NarL family two-component system response regulator LiaR